MTKDPEEKKQKQIQLIHKLATRLPWIFLGIFIFAFLLIVLQLYLSKL
jgi:hypothetical protein